MLYNEAIFKRHFPYRGKHFYLNIKGIIPYFRSMHHLVKYGYDDYAEWETAAYFIHTMRSVLKRYAANRSSTPVLVKDYPMGIPTTDEEKRIVQENDLKWEAVISRMIELLDLMDEENDLYADLDYSESFSKMEAAKEEFFNLFSKYFYHLWD